LEVFYDWPARSAAVFRRSEQIAGPDIALRTAYGAAHAQSHAQRREQGGGAPGYARDENRCTASSKGRLVPWACIDADAVTTGISGGTLVPAAPAVIRIGIQIGTSITAAGLLRRAARTVGSDHARCAAHAVRAGQPRLAANAARAGLSLRAADSVGEAQAVWTRTEAIIAGPANTGTTAASAVIRIGIQIHADATAVREVTPADTGPVVAAACADGAALNSIAALAGATGLARAQGSCRGIACTRFAYGHARSGTCESIVGTASVTSIRRDDLGL
jgi:hypothetical protein